MSVLLSCHGLNDWGVRIPPFDLKTNQLMGIALPIDFGVEWHRIMDAFSGISKHVGINTSRIAELLTPSSAADRYGRAPEGTTILNLINSRAKMPIDNSKSFLDRFDVDYSQPIQKMGATERFLIGIAECLATSTDLIVITTSGLSPLGYSRILAALGSVRNSVSSIVFFHTCDFDYFRRINFYNLFDWYDEIVECGLAQQ